MSIHHPDSSDPPVRKVAAHREKTGREVICKICQAVYVPAQTHMQLTRSPQAVVESAFMSMCHFCFRCRRPSCPSCWDDVHGVCGACAVDAQLSFRASVPPLDGVIFPPTHNLPVARVHTLTPPLVCVRPGRFQHAPLPLEAQTTLYIQTNSAQPVYDPTRRNISRKISISSSLPSSEPQSNAMETIQRTTSDVSSVPSLPRSVSKAVLDIEDINTRPQRRRVHAKERARTGQNQRSTFPVDIADITTRPGKRRVHHEEKVHTTTIRRDKLERVLAEMLSLSVLLVIIVIVSALFSPAVNDGIAHFLHVDIRAEIAYLLQLMQHLF